MQPLMKISNDIELKVSELPEQLLQRIYEDMVIQNPAYIKAVRMDLPGKNKIPETIKLYSYKDGWVILPRGYGPRLMRHFRETGTAYRVEDNRVTLPPVKFNSKIKLRNYQEPAVKALVKYRQGGVVAGCGAGKTMIMLEAMARIGQPSLWVTHTQELADQVAQRAVEVFDITKEEIGRIGGGELSIGSRLTVALIQTLSKTDLTILTTKFGAIFVDEAHHMAAKSFFYPIGQFPALYRLWASATPDRSDGLTTMVFAAGGPILHTVNQCQVPTITPGLEVIETDYSGYGEYVEVISDLIKNSQRNSLIVKTIAAEAPGNYCLALSDRVEHLEILQQMLKAALPNLVIEILTGSMGKKARAEIMDRVQARQVDILLATQLAREGLDIKHLNRLFLCTPKRAGGAVQQEVGRIMRPCEGKTDAVVFDFWDSKTPILKGQYWARREVYKKLGIQWKPNRGRCGSYDAISRTKKEISRQQNNSIP